MAPTRLFRSTTEAKIVVHGDEFTLVVRACGKLLTAGLLLNSHGVGRQLLRVLDGLLPPSLSSKNRRARGPVRMLGLEC